VRLVLSQAVIRGSCPSMLGMSGTGTPVSFASMLLFILYVLPSSVVKETVNFIYPPRIDLSYDFYYSLLIPL
jgi:hypothetical protein